MINPSAIASTNNMPGFRQVNELTHSFTVASQTLGAGAIVETNVSLPLVNDGFTSRIRGQFTTVSTEWQQLEGLYFYDTGVLFRRVLFRHYYTATNLVFNVTYYNGTASSQTFPAQPINLNIRLFKPPYLS